MNLTLDHELHAAATVGLLKEEVRNEVGRPFTGLLVNGRVYNDDSLSLTEAGIGLAVGIEVCVAWRASSRWLGVPQCPPPLTLLVRAPTPQVLRVDVGASLGTCRSNATDHAKRGRSACTSACTGNNCTLASAQAPTATTASHACQSRACSQPPCPAATATRSRS